MMSQAGSPFPAPDRAKGLTGAVGRRNVAYVVATLVLLALALLIEQFANGNDRGAGVLAGMLLWGLGSVVFFGINTLLILGWMVDQVRGGVPMVASPVSRAVLGCALPVVVLVIGMALA